MSRSCAAGPEVSITEARDRLVKGLNQQKPDKKLKLRVQAVPLEASQGNVALAESKAKGCQFVLFSQLTDILTAEKTVPSVTTGGLDSIPAITAKVSYQLEQTDGSRGIRHRLGEGGGLIFDQGRCDGRNVATGDRCILPIKERWECFTSQTHSQDSVATQKAPAKIDVAMIGTSFCKWLPATFPTRRPCAGSVNTP